MAISTSSSLQKNGDPMTSASCCTLFRVFRSRFLRNFSHFSHPTIKPSNIVIDAVSMSLMKGAVIDFATELIGSSFRVAENPQVSILPVPT